MDLLVLPAPCQDSGSLTCAAVYNATGNTFLAHAAEWLIGKPAAVAGLVALALVLRWMTHRAIDRIVRRAEIGVQLPSRLGHSGLQRGLEEGGAQASISGTRRVQRANSLGSLMKSLTNGIVLGVFAVMILSQVGVNVAPILASAGVLGLAIGFGAQTLVKDFLSGIFLVLEDQFGVGDVVDLGEATGTVEAVGLRVTRLRDIEGTVWYVRNGEIQRVGNQSQNWAQTVLDITVSYSENLDRVRALLAEIAHDLFLDEEYQHLVLEEPSVWGVQELGADGVVVRLVLKTAPLEQWNVAREMRERIKERFDEESIEIPLPQRVVWHRDAAPIGGSPTPTE